MNSVNNSEKGTASFGFGVSIEHTPARTYHFNPFRIAMDTRPVTFYWNDWRRRASIARSRFIGRAKHKHTRVYLSLPKLKRKIGRACGCLWRCVFVYLPSSLALALRRKRITKCSNERGDPMKFNKIEYSICCCRFEVVQSKANEFKTHTCMERNQKYDHTSVIVVDWIGHRSLLAVQLAVDLLRPMDDRRLCPNSQHGY